MQGKEEGKAILETERSFPYEDVRNRCCWNDDTDSVPNCRVTGKDPVCWEPWESAAAAMIDWSVHLLIALVYGYSSHGFCWWYLDSIIWVEVQRARARWNRWSSLTLSDMQYPLVRSMQFVVILAIATVVDTKKSWLLDRSAFARLHKQPFCPTPKSNQIWSRPV